MKVKSEIRKITVHISFGEIIHSYRMAQELCNIEKDLKFVSIERAETIFTNESMLQSFTP